MTNPSHLFAWETAWEQAFWLNFAYFFWESTPIPWAPLDPRSVASMAFKRTLSENALAVWAAAEQRKSQD